MPKSSASSSEDEEWLLEIKPTILANGLHDCCKNETTQFLNISCNHEFVQHLSNKEMGARQSKRSVDITTTPKKGDGEIVVEGEGKLEKIGDADVKATTNGAVLHTESETGDKENAESEKESKDAEIKENGLPESDDAKTPETAEANGDQVSETQEKAAVPEVETAKIAEETPEGKKSKEKNKKKKWSFRSISFSKKDKSKPSKEGEKNGEVKEVAEENAEETATSPSIESPKEEEAKPAQETAAIEEEAAKPAEEAPKAAAEESKVDEPKPVEEPKITEPVVEKPVESAPSPVKEETPVVAEPIKETKEVRNEEVPPPLPSSNPPSPVTVFAESTKANALTADQVPICSAPVVETIPEPSVVQSVVESTPQAASSPITHNVTESAPQIIESKVETISSPIADKAATIESEILPKETPKTESTPVSALDQLIEVVEVVESKESSNPDYAAEKAGAATPIETEVAKASEVPMEEATVVEQMDETKSNETPDIPTESVQSPEPVSVRTEPPKLPESDIPTKNPEVPIELPKSQDVSSDGEPKSPIEPQKSTEESLNPPELLQELPKSSDVIQELAKSPVESQEQSKVLETPIEPAKSLEMPVEQPKSPEVPVEMAKSHEEPESLESISKSPEVLTLKTPEVPLEAPKLPEEKSELTIIPPKSLELSTELINELPKTENGKQLEAASDPSEVPQPLPVELSQVEKESVCMETTEYVSPTLAVIAESPKSVPDLPQSPPPSPALGSISESLPEPAVPSPEPVESQSEPTKPVENAESLPDISTESLPSLPEPLSENLAEPMSLPPVDSVPEPIASDCPASDLTHPTNDSLVLTNGNSNGLPTPTDEVVSAPPLIEGLTKQVATEVSGEVRHDGDTPTEAATTETAAVEE